ncbi:MAG: 30S ribosomal protein S1 [Syntrophomonadaceae bacterium]|nr:30S ribosomal protein S1 [Syntrophomonadaceae bacterium]
MLAELRQPSDEAWQEIYSSRQNRSIVWWPVTGVEEISDGEAKVPCLIVTKDQVKGIIPLQESGVTPGATRAQSRGRLVQLIGQDIPFIVIGIDKDNDLFTASRSAATERLNTNTWAELTEGAEKTVIARRIVRRPNKDGTLSETGVMCEIEGVPAFLPIQEISYGWIDKISDFIQPGDVFKAQIVEADREKDRVVISVKALLLDPWPDAATRYIKNGIYNAEVTGVANYGVFCALEPGVNALCKHMRSGKPEKGDQVAVVVTNVDAETRRVNGLVLRILRRQ